ncbi:histidine kinase [Streptomyces sp. 150FB]|uniref:sensor histidine kinase n=1 Tax=Streptomyces sp. 150FB TaxID=1576605 RepID=UPI000697DAC7|nr:histidine kinase [Streptomyces sp. 150FB]
MASDLGIVLLALALTFVTARVRFTGMSLYPQLSTGLPDMSLSDPLARVLPWSNIWTDGQFLALPACLLLWWRRDRPVPVAIATLFFAICSPAVVPALVALFTVAVLCPSRTTARVTVLALVPIPATYLLDPSLGDPLTAVALIGCTLVAAAVGWGLFVRTLSERTDRAEAEVVLRAERAQQQAREDTAREMHDVLAHRLSLLSVHAGALEFHPGAPAEEVERAAGVIRESAHKALEDLQVVLRVLRAPADDGAAEPPQPTLADVRKLVAEARAAGTDVELDERIAEPADATGIAGRTAYRVVQEGLTNARKHAPDAPVRIAVHGGPREGISVDLRNALPRGGPHSGIPGTGQGLIGLTERAALAGGKVTYGRSADDFLLHAWLPWPP